MEKSPAFSAFYDDEFDKEFEGEKRCEKRRRDGVGKRSGKYKVQMSVIGGKE
ncbi:MULTISPECIES: hypothetical protein [Aneurinibacillus]|uniref:hypothetical protein n=1 Tax=Aneurinibacillus TaxID=55079 RepID=UPI000A547431|nr:MULTISPECIES: hypothetical protein [Aneurinibacillus]MED0678059.1 hypothetical protein [Aneurinibacillus thermoaerophilus]